MITIFIKELKDHVPWQHSSSGTNHDRISSWIHGSHRGHFNDLSILLCEKIRSWMISRKNVKIFKCIVELYGKGIYGLFQCEIRLRLGASRLVQDKLRSLDLSMKTSSIYSLRRHARSSCLMSWWWCPCGMRQCSDGCLTIYPDWFAGSRCRSLKWQTTLIKFANEVLDDLLLLSGIRSAMTRSPMP